MDEILNGILKRPAGSRAKAKAKCPAKECRPVAQPKNVRKRPAGQCSDVGEAPFAKRLKIPDVPPRVVQSYSAAGFLDNMSLKP